jgi:type V secretory pathway adhesin AidA
MAEWRNRIVGSGTEDPEKLLANPKNWRIHPKAQREALGIGQARDRRFRNAARVFGFVIV